MKKAFALLVGAWLIVGAGGASAKTEGVYARANWLQTVQVALFADVKRQFKTRYDGSVWAKSCRDPAYAQRLGINRKELSSFLFERLNARKDISKIQPIEKWMLVNAVAGMTEAYLQGGRAFVRATRQDCAIVIKGLRREFPQ